LQIENASPRHELVVKIKVAWIGKTKEPAIQMLTDEYLKRISRYAEVEGVPLRDEAALLKQAERSGGRPAHRLVLLDGRGKQLSSEELAKFLKEYESRNSQSILFGVGPADGFSDTAIRAAFLTLSLGRMTLPHELARIVLLEQLYRAFTIMNRHPYHSGH
jgi:23S rRNA (pseudouridine1915-N3)-methyltransferase